MHFNWHHIKQKELYMMKMETEALIMHLLGADAEVMEELLDFQ